MIDDFEPVEFVTRFEERESGKTLWRSGRFTDPIEYEEGMRPFPDRLAIYDPVETTELESPTNPDEAVFETAAADKGISDEAE